MTFSTSNSYIDRIQISQLSINSINNCLLNTGNLTSGLLSCWVGYHSFYSGDLANFMVTILQTDQQSYSTTAHIPTNTLPRPSPTYVVSKLAYPPTEFKLNLDQNQNQFYYNFTSIIGPQGFELHQGWVYIGDYSTEFNSLNTKYGFLGGNSSFQQYYGTVQVPSNLQPGYYVPKAYFQPDLNVNNLIYGQRYFTRQCIEVINTKTPSPLTIVSFIMDRQIVDLNDSDMETVSFKLVISGISVQPTYIGVSSNDGMFSEGLLQAISNNSSQLVYYGAAVIPQTTLTGRYLISVSITISYDEPSIDIQPSQLLDLNFPYYVDVIGYDSPSEFYTQNNTISNVVITSNSNTVVGGYQLNFTMETTSNGLTRPFTSYSITLIGQDRLDMNDITFYFDLPTPQGKVNASVIISMEQLCILGYTRYGSVMVTGYSEGLPYQFTNSILNVSIDQTKCDRIPAFIKELIISGPKYDPVTGIVDSTVGSKVDIDFHIIDAMSGFKSLELVIDTPTNTRVNRFQLDAQHLISGSSRDGIYRYTLTIPTGSNGNYTIYPGFINDYVNNYQYQYIQNLKLIGNPVIQTKSAVAISPPSITGITLTQNIITDRNQHLMMQVDVVSGSTTKVELLLNFYTVLRLNKVSNTTFIFDEQFVDYNRVFYYAIRVTGLDGTTIIYSTDSIQHFTNNIFIQSLYDDPPQTPSKIQSIVNTYDSNKHQFQQTVKFNNVVLDSGDLVTRFDCILTSVNDSQIPDQIYSSSFTILSNVEFICIFDNIPEFTHATYEFTFVQYEGYLYDGGIVEGQDMTLTYTPWILKNIYQLDNSFTFQQSHQGSDEPSISSTLYPYYLLQLLIIISICYLL